MYKANNAASLGGYALDISDTVMDNNAYKGQGKTAEEVMQNAGNIDVATQRDYMTVMSNTMSEEDFSKLQEEGYQPGNMDVEEAVTIVDKIKAELVKGGTQVVGYTDDLDEETLREITGSEAFARELEKQFDEHDIPLTQENIEDAKQAYDKAVGMKEPGTDAVRYMVENQMEPTIDNLYLADYSSANGEGRQSHGYYATDNTGYYAKKAEEYDWEQLTPQMEKVLEEAGIESSEESLASAKWLVETGIPLTAETMSRLWEIEQVSLPQDDSQILAAIAGAISDGQPAGSANLADGRSNLEKSADYIEAFAHISDEAADQVVTEGQTLTLHHLQQMQEKLDDENTADAQEQPSQENAADAGEETLAAGTPEQITARRQLEEVRLMMTIEANRKLLESGYSIDTSELEDLVEQLKKIEQQQNQILFGDTDASQKAALFDEVQQKTSEIPFLPAAVLADFVSDEESFTLNSAHTNGTALKNTYEAAQQSYETLMTAPRADMGDSIRKAFRNVDDILEDMGRETSEENRRAVRILGYNSMDITDENMDAVKKYDMELRQVIRKMTPAATLQAIRDDKNPLEMSMDELNQYLDENAQGTEAKEEKFSKYLYKLEKNHAIDEQERESYIGIFRMFRQLEKSDDASIGSLLKEGAPLSFQNLLTAMRSTKKQGMDYTVNDDFSGVNAVSYNKSITEQILSGFSNLANAGADEQHQSRQQGEAQEAQETYYSQLAGEIADSLEPEFLTQMSLSPEMTMEEFAQQLYEAQPDAALEEAYGQEQIQQYRDLGTVEDNVISELLAYQQAVTPDALHAMSNMRKNPGFLYQKLNDIDSSADKKKVKKAMTDMAESLTDKDSAQKAYDEMQDTFEGMIEEAEEGEITYLDLKALQSCKKQLSLAGSLAREENYQIPVEIGGELTAINLKVLHGSGGGKVTASMQTSGYGRVSAQFGIRNNTVSGYVACSSEDGTKLLQEKEEALRSAFKESFAGVESPPEIGSFGIVHSEEMNVGGYAKEDLEPQADEQIQIADLYKIAKAFIVTVAD
jgi:hypothetical protein